MDFNKAQAKIEAPSEVKASTEFDKIENALARTLKALDSANLRIAGLRGRLFGEPEAGPEDGEPCAEIPTGSVKEALYFLALIRDQSTRLHTQIDHLESLS